MSTKYNGHKSVHKPDGSTAESWFAYTCGHCGRASSGAVIGYVSRPHTYQCVRWIQCPTCGDASVQSDWDNVYLFPGVAFGPLVEGLPKNVQDAYLEARRCLGVSAYTASEGICRKILMYVACDKGAEEGKSFASYIDHLQKNGYITPPMSSWVTLIKDHANEAQHRLDPPDQKRAEGTLLFTAQLLRSVYEMGHLAAQYTPAPKVTGS